MKKNQNWMSFTDWAAYGFKNLCELHQDFVNDAGSDLGLRDFIIQFYKQCVHFRCAQGAKSWKNETANLDWILKVKEVNQHDKSLIGKLFELIEIPEPA